MTRLIKGLILFSAIILLGMSFISCSDGGNREPTTGTLELSLIDNPGAYQEVVISIIEVQVHHETDGWVTLSGNDLNVPLQVNLLDLVGGTMAYLGATELEPGHYDQMRLILDSAENANYIVVDDVPQTLKIPSGYTTGVKLVHGFDIVAAGATELILDFDVDKSIVMAGKSGKYILKPTIKVVDTVANSVSGMVSVDGEDSPSEVKISAQSLDLDVPQDQAERVVSVASTWPDPESDTYFMYLPLLPAEAPPYNIVATLSGYFPDCEPLPSNPDGENITGEYDVPFNLSPIDVDTVTFYGRVKGLDEDEEIVISIRQENVGDCEFVEVASLSLSNMLDTDPDLFISTLPTGNYQVVIIAEDGSTLSAEWWTDVMGDQLIDLDYTPTP